jgi:hypothetical protein
MAQYYHLDENNTVDCVCNINDQEILDPDGNEVPNLGILLCQKKYGYAEWVYSEDSSISKGSVYYPELDEIYPPKPYPSWIHRTETKNWKSPIGDPPTLSEAEKHYTFDWDEENQQWVKMDPAPQYQ